MFYGLGHANLYPFDHGGYLWLDGHLSFLCLLQYTLYVYIVHTVYMNIHVLS